MSQKLFLNTGQETIKGGALHALKDAGNAGAYDFATLTLTGVAVDQETFTLGDDVYEVNLITTDNTQDTGTGGEYNNTSPVINVPLTGMAPGDVILVESEFMIVLEASASSAYVSRGFAGSTIAAHGNSITVFEAAQQVAAGNFAVPLSAAAAATADGEIIAAVQFWSDGGYRKGLGGGIGVQVQNGLKVDALQGAGTSVIFAYPADGGVASTAEGFTNGTLSAFAGGIEPANQRYAKVSFVSAGTGAEDLVAPFAISSANVKAYDATSGRLLNANATGGVVVEAAVAANNRLVTVSGAGKAAGQVIVVEMVE